jgi:hypothetical protein
MQKYHHSHEENKKKYGVVIANRINNDSLLFVYEAILKNNIDDEPLQDIRFKKDYQNNIKTLTVNRKLFFKNKLVGRSQKKYKLL